MNNTRPIHLSEKQNFSTLIDAIQSERACLFSCYDSLLNQPAVLICAVNITSDVKDPYEFVPLGVVEVLGVDALDDVRLAKHIDLQSLFARQRQVAIVWEVDDVLVLRPDLSDDQAWEVLQHAQQEHDAEIGLNWHALESATTALFGPETAPEESNA
jgi:hypothetical protein